MSRGPVAVIDIGSNSIKILVAARSAEGGITPLLVRTIDARISAGISQNDPRLRAEGMARGIDAVRTLLAAAEPHRPARFTLVATSAVRDARNGSEFSERLHAATGHRVRILSGNEEANLIGRGLTVDPALQERQDFYVFDLGGGSLECLAFRARTVTQAVSLPLGCVRLTEKFVPDSTQPLADAVRQRVIAHTREVIARSGFRFNLPAGATAVGTGGTVTTVRAILGAREGRSFEATPSLVPVHALRTLLDALASLSLDARKQIPGLPPPRADVYPVALATLIALADAGGLSAYQNSLYNLRFGLAAELLRFDEPKAD